MIFIANQLNLISELWDVQNESADVLVFHKNFNAQYPDCYLFIDEFESFILGLQDKLDPYTGIECQKFHSLGKKFSFLKLK